MTLSPFTASSPTSPGLHGTPSRVTTLAMLPTGWPTEPYLRFPCSSGLVKIGAAVSVIPMVSMIDRPNFLSKARCNSGASAAEADRPKRTRLRPPGGASGAGDAARYEMIVGTTLNQVHS